jgi:peroxiredoxin
MLEGKMAPKVILEVRKRDNRVRGNNKFSWDMLDTNNIYKNKRIIIFALPGAFTPTCSNTHLPGYERNYNKIRKLGIDEIYCLSVNDAFVMFNWCKSLKVKNVKPLPDGNAKFTKKMGALVNKSNLGFGKRSWRYSMVINNGKIEKLFVEGGRINNCPIDPFEVSDADTMIKYLSK